MKAIETCSCLENIKRYRYMKGKKCCYIEISCSYRQWIDPKIPIKRLIREFFNNLVSFMSYDNPEEGLIELNKHSDNLWFTIDKNNYSLIGVYKKDSKSKVIWYFKNVSNFGGTYEHIN